MTVVDASAVAAALIDAGTDGAWARSMMGQQPLAGPHLMPVEVASVLRRAVLTQDVSPDAAALAHNDLASLAVDLYPYQPFAARIWELRHSIRPYDGWYVALAEALDVPLATLDRRLTRASGPRCSFLLPPEAN